MITHPARPHPSTATSSPPPWGRLRRHAFAVVGALRRSPATMALIMAVWLIGAATGSLLHGPSAALRQLVGVGSGALLAGRWWTPLTSGLWCPNLAGYLVTTGLLLALAAPAERRVGSGRTCVLLLTGQIVGTVLGSALILAARWTGDPWTGRLAQLAAVGASPAAIGTGLAMTAWLTAVWRRRLRLLILLTVVLLAAYRGSLIDLFRVVAGVVGLIAGMIMAGHPRPGTIPRGSVDERRALVALALTVTAVGPLVVALTGTALGPLSSLRYVLITPVPDPATVQQICIDPATADDCRAVRALIQLSGVGPVMTTLLPVMLLLIAADGLRRGRRAAWVTAIAVNLTLAAVAVHLVSELVEGPAPVFLLAADAGRSPSHLEYVLPFAVPLVMTLLLLVTRTLFRVSAPRGTYRRVGAVVGGTLLLLVLLYPSAGTLLRNQFDRPPGPIELLANLPTRFVPPGYLGDVDPAFLPTEAAATVLYEWTGPVLLTVLGLTLLWSFRRNQPLSAGPVDADPGEADRERAHALLQRHGGPALSYLITWPGNNYHFGADGDTVIGYRVAGTVAVGLIGPIGPAAGRDTAIADFADFCAGQGLTPCLYSIPSDVRDAATRCLGWRSVQVAQDTVVPLAGFSLRGKKGQSVRTAMNKAGQLGITAQWISYRTAAPSITRQIVAISRQWVADKGLPEMGFTLGGLRELADPHVRCLIAIDGDGAVHAVVSFLPVYDDGRPVAWTLDFMRRRSTGFPGAVEYLIASAARQFRDEGARYLSLSGAPLARVSAQSMADPIDDQIQQLLDTTSRALEPVYGFQSLLEFKSKFQPEYHPLWLSYPEPVSLPIITNAVMKCYVPRLTPRQGFRLLRSIFRSRHRNRPRNNRGVSG